MARKVDEMEQNCEENICQNFVIRFGMIESWERVMECKSFALIHVVVPDMYLGNYEQS